MRMRPYIERKDFKYIETWIHNEREHALWCANCFPYPVTMESFHALLEKSAEEWEASAFVVVDDSGKVIGFFCYSVNLENDEGFLSFIIIDSSLRGKGYGKQVIQLALRYAFDMTGAKLVQLNVFEENINAKHCYEQLGFVNRNRAEDVFVYNDEVWNRHNMVITNSHLFLEHFC